MHHKLLYPTFRHCEPAQFVQLRAHGSWLRPRTLACSTTNRQCRLPPTAVALVVCASLCLRGGRSAPSTSQLERLTEVPRMLRCALLSCAPSSTPSSSPSGRRARAGVQGGADAAAGCPRPSTAPILFRSQDMDPDPSPRVRCTRCAALCRLQARAEHQLDQAPDARVARARH